MKNNLINKKLSYIFINFIKIIKNIKINIFKDTIISVFIEDKY